MTSNQQKSKRSMNEIVVHHPFLSLSQHYSFLRMRMQVSTGECIQKQTR